MPAYRFEWKIRLMFWLMGSVMMPSPATLRRARSGTRASPPDFIVGRFPLAGVENRRLPGRAGEIPVRIYRPTGAGPLGLLVFYHGGGFALGGLDSHDALCRRIAAENGLLVVSVDYRLAPEHKFPAAVEDASDALAWVAEHASQLGGDPGRLFVMGDSAGGNLSAVVSLLARDAGGPRIAAQVLVYPVVDIAGSHPSKDLYPDTAVLPREAMDFYSAAYLRQPADAQDPRVSPLLAPDLRGLPPALILVAEYDPLRDEGLAYAERLRQAGNPVSSACYPRMPHGFLSLGRLASQTDAAFAAIRQFFAQY